jgi:hypothetical protein
VCTLRLSPECQQLTHNCGDFDFATRITSAHLSVLSTMTHPFYLGISLPLSALSRLFISLPALKNGSAFSRTGTVPPVRGLRPILAFRILSENVPKPRNSTRSPRAIALLISSKMAPTTFSISRTYKWGFADAMRWTSSDLIMDVCPRLRAKSR